MVENNVPKGAKTMIILLNGYMNTVGKVIGKEKALNFYTKACDGIGAKRGKMTKQQSDIKQFDAKLAWSMLVKNLKDDSGFTYEILEESPERVVVRNTTCPFYEAAKTLGIDDKTFENYCRAGSMRMADAAIKQLNPKLSIRVQKFRSPSDGYCDEEIILG
jgi:hypothetical protein